MNLKSVMYVELSGCATLTLIRVGGSTKVCVRAKCLEVSFSRTMHFSEVCFARGWTVTSHPTPPLGLWVACGSGVRGFVVLGGEGSGSSIQSNHIELTVTTRFKQGG